MRWVETRKVVVRAFVEAVNQKDWRRFDELAAPDFGRYSSTFGQQIRSRDQFRDFPASEDDCNGRSDCEVHCSFTAEAQQGYSQAFQTRIVELQINSFVREFES